MESKQSEGKNDDNDGDFFVEELVKFTNTSNYVEKVQRFMTQNCAGFETYHQRIASGEGNKFEWMDLYREFQEMVDEELENFCNLHNAVPSEVFRVIEDYVRKSDEEEFIPLFLKTMNEEHFFEQMCACATELTKEETALATLQNESKGEASMSGIWYLVPESIDTDDLNNWLKALGMPWPFKKLFMSAHKKPMKAIINHVPGNVFEISIGIPFFGQWTVKVTLDGEWSVGKDRMGKPLRLLGEEGECGDVTLNVKDRNDGLMMAFFTMTGPNSVRMHREYFYGGTDSGAPVAKLTCSFRK